MRVHLWLAILLVSSVVRAGADTPNIEPLVHEAVVGAPLAAVWDAFCTGPGQESWDVAHAEVEMRVGGKMRTHYSKEGKIGDEGTIEQTILSFDPHRMFSFRTTGTPVKFPFPAAIAKTWV